MAYNTTRLDFYLAHVFRTAIAKCVSNKQELE